MVLYDEQIKKAARKGDVPVQILRLFNNAFLSLDMTKDFRLFDVKKLKGNYLKDYFRLRKGKFRAIFFIENSNIHVIYIGKRDEVYDLWQ